MSVKPGSIDCYDCSGPAEQYMVRDSIWRAAWPEYEAVKTLLERRYRQGPLTFLCLCLGCLEDRMGRPPVRDDFDFNIPLNYINEKLMAL